MIGLFVISYISLPARVQAKIKRVISIMHFDLISSSFAALGHREKSTRYVSFSVSSVVGLLLVITIFFA